MLKKKFISAFIILSMIAAVPAAFADEETTDETGEVTSIVETIEDPSEMPGPPVVDLPSDETSSGETIEMPDRLSTGEDAGLPELPEDEQIPDPPGGKDFAPVITYGEENPDLMGGAQKSGSSNDLQAPAFESTNPYASEGNTYLPFEDVASDAWYHDVVLKAYNSNLISGMSETQFAPNSAVTGAQLLTILFRSAGNSLSEQTTEHWYDEAVSWAAQSGIISSDMGWEFAPEAELTREQMMVILYNYKNTRGETSAESFDITLYEDGGDVSDYAKTAASWLVAKGYIVGDGRSLRPGDTLSRAETAVIVVGTTSSTSVGPQTTEVGRPEDNLSLYQGGAQVGEGEYEDAPEEDSAVINSTPNLSDQVGRPEDNLSAHPERKEELKSAQTATEETTEAAEE